MLTEYQLTNFKAFGETVTIPIRPITLIFGPNSSGKSSILQSLLMLKQTLEKNHDLNSLIPKGRYVDLGSYHELIHASKKAGDYFSFQMKFSNIETALSQQADSVLGLSNLYLEDDRDELLAKEENWNAICNYMTAFLRDIALSNSYGLIEKDLRDSILLKEELFLGKSQNVFWSKTQNGRGDFAKEHAYWKLWEKYYNMMRHEIDAPLLTQTLDQTGVATQEEVDSMIAEMKKSRSRYQEYPVDDFHRAFPGAASDLIRNTLCKIENIPPLRDYPERYYTLKIQSNVKSFWHNVFPKLNKPETIEQINEGLDQCKIAYKFSIKKHEVNNPDINDEMYSMRLFNNETEVESNLCDVGFGLSQILPIIIGAKTEQEKILLIEQPELHLHPALQAEMGNLFVDSLKQQHNTFLIETHSEHLILRFQKLVRKKILSHEEIAVLYVSQDEDGSNVQQLHLDEDGQFLDPWPGGFFPERLNEILGD